MVRTTRFEVSPLKQVCGECGLCQARTPKVIRAPSRKKPVFLSKISLLVTSVVIKALRASAKSWTQ